MKAAILFVVLFFSSLNLIAKSDKRPYAPFDWVKVDHTVSFENFAWESLPQGITQAMIESLLASPFNTSTDPITLFYLNEQLLMVIPCRFEVLKWTGESWENLYKGTGSGFNCHAHFFVREGKLYSMGRYGFWRGHSELLEFDFETGYWEFVPVSSPPMNYGGVGIFVDGDRVISILGENIHQPSNVFFPDKNGYVFDFKSKAWSSLKLDFPTQKNQSSWIMPAYDLKDYGVQLYQLDAHLGLLLLHKKENTLYFIKENNFGKFKSFAVAVALENNAVFFDKYGDPTFLLPPKAPLEKFTKVGELRITKQTSSIGLEDWSLYILATLLILMAVGGGFWWRRSKGSGTASLTESEPTAEEQGTVDGEEDIARLVARLIAHPHSLVDVHQLDDLFGTAALESLDYRRVRRSRFIKAVNQYFQGQHGKDLISRTKSEADKRIILYRISP
ncbi:MAG: hypothetical protein RLZZ207_739 [Bacteroidota bacterium]